MDFGTFVLCRNIHKGPRKHNVIFEHTILVNLRISHAGNFEKYACRSFPSLDLTFWKFKLLYIPNSRNFGKAEFGNVEALTRWKNKKSNASFEVSILRRDFFVKCGPRKLWNSASYLLKILNMGLISTRKHEMETLGILKHGHVATKPHRLPRPINQACWNVQYT